MGFFDPFGGAADVGELKSDLSSLKSDVETHTNNNDIHVTASDKSNWNSKLDKNQGTENSGKVLGTNANGEVIPLNGYGFEYDEETKMLKYGTDPTTNLNQGIGLDDTLSKRGYAADAGAVGELKEDLDAISELSSTYEVELIFDDSKNGHYINTSGQDRTVANAKYSEPFYFTRGTLIKFKVQGQANVFGVISRVEDDGSLTVVRISDTSTYKWYSYEVVRDGYYVFCGYYNKYDWVLLANANKQNQIDSIVEYRATIFDNQKTHTTVSLIVGDNDNLYFDVTDIYDTCVKVYDIINGEYLDIKNIRTKNVCDRVCNRGTFVIDVKNTEKIRFENYPSSENAPVSLSAYMTLKNIENSVAYMDSCAKVPVVDSAVEVSKVGNYIPQGYVDGIVYGMNLDTSDRKSYKIVKSTNNGANFTTLATFDTDLHRVIALDNGCFLIFKSDKTVLRTNNFNDYTTVLTVGLLPHTLFGITVYKNRVLISEYGGVGGDNPGRIVHYSEDYGATFRQIFDLANFDSISGYHLHSASYDPYEQLIWVCCGDGKDHQMYFVSADNGATFKKCGENGNMPTQATFIAPLRDCVLFLSDSRLVGSVRYNRPKTGTNINQKFEFEQSHIIAEGWGKTGATEVPIASTAYIDYDKSVVIYGYACVGTAYSGSTLNELNRGAVYASNGHVTKRIYKYVDTKNSSIYGIWGDNTSGKIAVRLAENSLYSLVLDISGVWI